MDSLRLSGQTLAKIFTDEITNWDDPAITKDNNGHFLTGGAEVTKLPSTPIIPVVHSEGSGSTAQFTLYLDTEFTSMWRSFAKVPSNELGAAPGKDFTEYWPRSGNQIAENGSDGVINFVTSAAGNGAIGFDEYSYALNTQCSGCVNGWPTALLENQAGYFTAPTQYNVAVALTKAQINLDKSSPNYLLQKLDNVYTNPDKRTYAMSSYSYMIIPTSPTDQRMTTAEAARRSPTSSTGTSAAASPRWARSATRRCRSTWPRRASRRCPSCTPRTSTSQIANLNVATQCHNPTFWAGHPNGNFLAQIAPEPPACDKSGQGPCQPSIAVGAIGNPTNGKPPAPTYQLADPDVVDGSRARPARPPGRPPAPVNAGAPGGTTGGTAPGGSTTAGARPSSARPRRWPRPRAAAIGGLLAALAGLEVLLLLALPPIIARRRQSRQPGGSGRGPGA